MWKKQRGEEIGIRDKEERGGRYKYTPSFNTRTSWSSM
jgi:hypothetical protein